MALNYGVSFFAAVLKSANFRSRALLANLGFEPASPEQVIDFEAEPDELVMLNNCKNQRKFDCIGAGQHESQQG